METYEEYHSVDNTSETQRKRKHEQSCAIGHSKRKSKRKKK